MKKLAGVVRILVISVLLVIIITLLLPVLGAEKGYPVPGGVTLSIWFTNPGAPITKSLGDRLCFQEAEKRTGIKIKWTCPASGLDNEQFNLMLASRDLPDLTGLPSGMGGWLTAPGGARKFYDDGVIIKLNDLIDKYAPNIKALLKKEPEVRKQLVDDQGNIFFIPQMRIQPEIRIYTGFMIRQDWLDKLGLKAPTTPDEWYTVLKAFKTKDPNGNGKADEIPFGASRMNTNSKFTRMLWMFGANVGSSYSNGLQQQKGKVVFSPISAEYKQALAWIRKLYAEGLLDPDFPILERTQFEAKIYANQVGALFGNAGSGVQKHMTAMVGKEPKSFKLVGIPYPKAPGKKGYDFESSVIELATGNGLAITTACKNPVAAIKWLDYAFSKEGHMLFNFGVLGKTYIMDKGYPRFTSLITNNPQKLTMSQAMSIYINENWLGPQDGRYFEQYQKLPIPGVAGTPAWDAIQTWTKSLDTSLTMPPISLAPAESQQTVAKFNEINTYVQEMYHRFILGTAKLDEFDAYVAKIKKMGIDDVVKAYQAALNQYNAR